MTIIKKYKRKIIQLTSAILYNLNFSGFKNVNIYKGDIKKFCVPGLNCYSCPGAIASCPLGSFQNYLQQSGGKITIISRFPFYVLGLLILFGAILGRVVCGFLCPFGLLQEIIYKIKTPKVQKNNFTRKLTIIKYMILVVFVIAIPIALNYPGFCKYICPQGTIEAGIFHVAFNKNLSGAVGTLFNFKLFIAAVVIILSLFMYRFFCRFICPLGAFYSFFNKVAIFGLKVDNTKCIHCGACAKDCLMDTKIVSDRECIQCGECIDKCEVKAIKVWKK